MDSIQVSPIQNLSVLPLRYSGLGMIDLYIYFIILLHFRIDNKHLSSNPTFSIASTQPIKAPHGHAHVPHPPDPELTHPLTHHITSSD